MIAQAVTGTPGHVNTMAAAVAHFIDDIGPERIHPGDAYITNDPWKGTGHLHDITVCTPVFHRRRAGRVLRIDGPRRRCRWARLWAGRARGLRGGHPHPHHEMGRAGRAQRRPGADHSQQRARSRSGRRRHPRSGRVQRDRAPTPRLDARRVRAPRSRRSRRVRVRPDPSGDPRGARLGTRGDLPQRDDGRRLRPHADPRGDAHRRRRRHARGLHRHLAGQRVRDQRAAHLRPGVLHLRHARGPGPGVAQQLRVAGPVHRLGAARRDPQRATSGTGRGTPRDRALRDRPLPRGDRPGPPSRRSRRGRRRPVELPGERPERVGEPTHGPRSRS